MPTDAWASYLKKNTLLYSTAADVFGNAFGAQTVDQNPRVPLHTWNALSDVAGTAFFSPSDHE